MAQQSHSGDSSHPAIVAVQSQSHGSNHQRPGVQFLSSSQKSVPPRRSTCLQNSQSQEKLEKPACHPKLSLPLSTFHSNILTIIYRRSTYKYFPSLVRKLEDQRRQLDGTGRTLDDSDEEWPPQSTPSPHDSGSEASKDTLNPPSDTELFGLVAKSPPSPSPSPSSKEQTGLVLRSGRRIGSE